MFSLALDLQGSGTLNLQGNFSNDTDLTYLRDPISLSFLDANDQGFAHVDLATGVDLSLRAKQASGQYITGDSSATIWVPWTPSLADNISAQTVLSNVLSTRYMSGAAWADAWQTNNPTLTSQINGFNGGVTLTGANGEGEHTYFTFDAPKAGTYTFNWTFDNNYYGQYTNLNGFNNGEYSVYNNSDRFNIYTNVNNYEVDQSTGWLHGGSSTYTVTMVEGERLTVEMYSEGGDSEAPIRL